MSKKASECVRVVVRCRPLSEKEVAAGYGRVVDMDVQRGVVNISSPRGRMDEPPREFTFDAVYDWNSRQRDLYDETFRTVVDSVLEGYNGTIFAYGQTGTGKTYTMEGIRSNPEERGVIPNSFDHIFTHIARTENKKFLVRTSYLEIYQDEVRDLLSKDQKKRLELKERADTGVYVKDLSAFVAKSVKEIEHVMNVGNQNRSVGATDMNEHSSRSHAVFIVTVECAERGPDGEDHIRVGKLNLVDLAGSERQAKTGSTGQRFKEATRINLSLSALGNVISALVDGKSSHIPYRDSKLTRLLQDSLGGNAKTCMVATIGPADYNHEESLTTLRYANRAKNIKNKPRINEDPQDALLREYQEEIAKLKSTLEKRSKRGSKEKRQRKRGGAEGKEEEAADLELTLKEEQAQLEQEKEAILKNQELLEEERQSLLASTQDRVEQLKKEQKKRDSLASKIKAMESKLLAGGLNIFDRTNEQERELEQQRQKMIEQKRREREIQQQLMAKEESAMEIRETFASLQEEVEHKTKKLNKLRSKLKASKAELEEQKREQARAREELVIILENLQKELKLRTLIVDNFIPPEVTQRVCDRAMYSEEEETWTLPPFRGVESNEPGLKRPVSALGNIRPIATHAREAAITGNPRYKAENILQLELDMPTRTTHDYEGAGMAPLVQAVLDAALNEEGEDLTIDASTIEDVTGGLGVPKSHQRKKQRRRKPSKESSSGLQQSGQTQQAHHFPSKRGLVQTAVRFA